MDHSNQDFIEFEKAAHYGKELKNHYTQLIQWCETLKNNCTKLIQEIREIAEKYNLYTEILDLSQLDQLVKQIKISSLRQRIQKNQDCFNNNIQTINESFIKILKCLTINISDQIEPINNNKSKSKISIREILQQPQDNINYLNYQFKCQYGGHEKNISCLAISRDDSLMASGAQDNKIILWSFHNLSIKNIYHGTSSPSNVLFSPNNKRLFATSAEDILVFKLNSEETFIPYITLNAPSCITQKYLGNNSIQTLALTNDSEYLISGGDDQTINVWEIQSKSIVYTLFMDDSVSIVTLSNNQQYLGCYCWKIGEIFLFNSSKISKLKPFFQTKLLTFVNCIEFTPDSTSLLITNDKSVTVWYVDPLKKTLSIRRVLNIQYSLYSKISNDGSVLFLYSYNEILILNYQNFKLIQRLEIDISCQQRLVLSSDMQYIIANSGKNIYQFAKR